MSARLEVRFVFFLTLLLFFLQPIYFSWVRIHLFYAYLVYIMIKYPLIKGLKTAFLIGILYDVTAFDTPFGLFPFIYVSGALLIFYLKNFFLQNEQITLPILTIVFSMASTLLHSILLHLFFTPIATSLSWIISDLIIYSCLDGLSAYVTIILPLLLLRKVFLLKKYILLLKEKLFTYNRTS